jgi:hypothetical protein
LTVTALSAAQPVPAPRRELDNVVTFARLYGVIRYFYPSDAATAIDWNLFAVEGVRRVRPAPNTKSLDAVLENLVALLGPGIEIAEKLSPAVAAGKTNGRLVAWRYLGPGFDAPVSSNVQTPYLGKRTNRSRLGDTIDGFATLMQTVPAAELRGKRIRLRGYARATARSGSGAAALWLRVDRPDQQVGFFDNMSDRPIRETEWREYTIDGPVADDAIGVAFGIMAAGAVVADFDRIEVTVRDGEGTATPVVVNDAGFEQAVSATAKGWFRAGTSRNAQITRLTEKAPQGHQFVRLSAPPTSGVGELELFDGSPLQGDYVDIDLGLGLTARVPLALSEADAAVRPKQSTPITSNRREMPTAGTSKDEQNIRLADVVVTWNVFRHFYPYWTEAGVDWDTRLRPQLERAYSATSRDAHRDALRRVVAEARDGHGNVNSSNVAGPRAALPLHLNVVEGQLIVTASAQLSEVPVGAVLSEIDGLPATNRLADSVELSSGTTQWKQQRALQEIVACADGAVVKLTVRHGTGTRTVALRCRATLPPVEPRPQAVAELHRGVWYVDVTRARMAQISPVMSKLQSATGVIFDVRGYPTEAGAQILPHLIDAAEADRWMHVAKIVGPFGRLAGWHSIGWNLQPSAPRLAGKIVFLTDARAISYAESVLGYVADRKLGTIVGSTTAGANGNVVTFGVPGGFTISFTGMRVTRHDGRTPHHLVGIKPDVPAEPTISGIRAGRDEVLERGVALIR